LFITAATIINHRRNHHQSPTQPSSITDATIINHRRNREEHGEETEGKKEEEEETKDEQEAKE
jgi:hypothetical protein